MAKGPQPGPSAAVDPAPSGGRSTAQEIISSEEQLVIGSKLQVTGRAVLRKYVVTETVTQTFQVRHEEVRLDYLPALPDDEQTPSDRVPFSGDVVVEMLLHREVPRVQLDVVAVERVRLHVDTTVDQVQVSDDVRKEQLDVEPNVR